MCFFFYNLEELYHGTDNDCNGRIVATFPDSKAIFINVIHRDRSGAYTLEYTILKNPHKPD